MILKADVFTDAAPTVLQLRCPSCRNIGTFDSLGGNDKYLQNSSVIVGHRRCPSPTCLAHVFVIYAPGAGSSVIASYPAELIDFDATNIPTPVVNAFEEAIQCHATQSFVAAAIMVRKTLEELCADREATGANLKERIAELGNKVVLPKELLDGLDDLRLLGNDAAHIESNVYDNIGKEEVEIGIEFTKEVLKATYQYSDLLGRLRALKVQQET